MKEAGSNGMPPEEFKDTDEDCRKHVFDFINEFFHGRADLESWHKIKCFPVPKSGDLSYPNKWKGVTIMDVM